MSHIDAALEVEDQRRELRAQAGHWLKERRESGGLSQRELAGRVGMGYYTFVSQIEAGRGRIPPERYEAWACALGLDAREFAMRMLGYYEPLTYQLIFGERAAG